MAFILQVYVTGLKLEASFANTDTKYGRYFYTFQLYGRHRYFASSGNISVVSSAEKHFLIVTLSDLPAEHVSPHLLFLPAAININNNKKNNNRSTVIINEVHIYHS